MWEGGDGSRNLFWKPEEKRISGRYRLKREIILE